MDDKQFWNIIEQAKTLAGHDWEARPEALESLLRNLSPQEVIEFDKHFTKFLAESYDNNLWGAIYLLNGGGCSDDGFEYFRRWLISEGEDNFYRALKDPDSLAEFAEPDVELELFGYVARSVYEELTGEEMPEYPYPAYELKGAKWDDDDLKTMFPKIAAVAEDDEEEDEDEEEDD